MAATAKRPGAIEMLVITVAVTTANQGHFWKANLDEDLRVVPRHPVR